MHTFDCDWDRSVVSCLWSPITPINRHTEKAGGSAFVFRADVAVQAEVEALVAAAVDKWGHLDVFVNNSAVSGSPAPIERETEAQVDLLTAINFKGTLWGIQAAAKVLQSGGSIINVSSRAATLAFPGFGVYAGPKSAVDTLTRNVANTSQPVENMHHHTWPTPGWTALICHPPGNTIHHLGGDHLQPVIRAHCYHRWQ